MNNHATANPLAGAIVEDSRRKERLYLTMGILIAVMVVPISVDGVVREPQNLTRWAELLLLCGFAAFVLATPIRLAILHRKFGLARFEPGLNPPSIGGQLSGTIFTGLPVRFDSDVRLTLSCLDREVIGSGKSAHAVFSTRWHDQHFLTSKLPTSNDSTRIPVYFEIPPHCQPTERINAKEQIIWRLSAESTADQKTFHVDFTVPVHEAAPHEPVPDTSAEFRVAAPAATKSLARGVHIRESGEDELEATFAALRHPLLALEYAAFLALFVGAPIVLANVRYVGHVAAIVFGIIFGLIALVIFPSAFSLWLSRSRVRVRLKTMELTRGWLLYSSTLRFEAGEITSIKSAMSMNGVHNDQLYSLEIHTHKHPCETIADALSRHDADTIALRLRKAMGITVPTRTRKKPVTAAE
jgi:hypothetical protein